MRSDYNITPPPSAERLVVQSLNVVLAGAGCVVLGVLACARADPLRQKSNRLRVCVIFEGRDAAGKGGVIKRITDPLNPRICRVAALSTPTEKERGQWYFQRYVAELPSVGEIVLFDRSWYNRAGVEHVMGFCADEEYLEFLRACPLFEEMLIKSGIILAKYWFSVNDEEQEVRFQERMRNPIKRWKLSGMDVESRRHWVDYSRAKDAMFAETDTKRSARGTWSIPTTRRNRVWTASRICCRGSHTRTSSRSRPGRSALFRRRRRPQIGARSSPAPARRVWCRYYRISPGGTAAPRTACRLRLRIDPVQRRISFERLLLQADTVEDLE